MSSLDISGSAGIEAQATQRYQYGLQVSDTGTSASKLQ